jgi:hypothetical protein
MFLVQSMMYLIGGAPRIGKTTIATKLAEEIGCKLISTDDLGKSQQGHSVVFYTDPLKNILTSNERLQVALGEAKQREKELFDLVENFDNTSRDIVVEGIHLLPSYVSEWMVTFGSENINAIFIGSTDIEMIVEGMRQNTSPNNWLSDFCHEVQLQIAEFVQAFSLHVAKEIEEYGLTYRERSLDFQKDVADVMSELMKYCF